jgi:hypothetical protein
LIGAAAEHNPQNAALRQLQQDAAGWFASQAAAPSDTPTPPADAAPPAPPTYRAGGDVIIATIGADAKNVAVGKNITQSTDDAQPRPPA